MQQYAYSTAFASAFFARVLFFSGVLRSTERGISNSPWSLKYVNRLCAKFKKKNSAFLFNSARLRPCRLPFL